MRRKKRSTHCKPWGEAWREKALERAGALTCRVLGQTLAASPRVAPYQSFADCLKPQAYCLLPEGFTPWFPSR